MGDVMHSRVARSNVWLLAKMGASVVLCAPPTLMPPGIEALARVTHRIEEALEGADAVMMLRLQLERMSGGYFPTTREYHLRFGLTEERVRRAKKDVLILHPGPMNRGVEIASEVADGPYSVILDQVTNGVAVRMAVLYLLLGGGGGRGMTPAAGQGRAGAGPRAAARRPPATCWSWTGRSWRPGAKLSSRGAEVVDASGLVVCPGFIDAARAPARARARGQGDDRDGHARGGGGRLHRRLRDAQHGPGQRHGRDHARDPGAGAGGGRGPRLPDRGDHARLARRGARGVRRPARGGLRGRLRRRPARGAARG